MRRVLFMTVLVIVGIFYSSQLACSQEPITHEKILSSFAKIIRTKQYVCQTCDRVDPLENGHTGLSYQVVCNNDLIYKVVLTPKDDMLVSLLSSL